MISFEQVLALRLRAQHLTRQSTDGTKTVAGIVKGVCGIQAQEALAAALAIRVRGSKLLASDVERTLVQERSIVRTWGPRGTLHLLATEDLRWLLRLLGPVFIAANRRRREELGLDEETCQQGIHLLGQILANQGALTRAEIVQQLALHGLQLEGQARPHLLMRAALEGVLCFGPDSGAEPAYVLMDDWLEHERQAPAFSEEMAYAELSRRYLAAYGPATPHDQAAWSGLPLSRIRQAWGAIAEQLVEVEIAGVAAWMLKEYAAWLDEQAFPPVTVHLLPRFDIYLLGYQKRDLVLPAQYARRVNAGGGMIHPTILVDGRVIGTWKSVHKKKVVDISIEPFEALPARVYPGLEAEIADLAHFLGVASTWQVLALPQSSHQ